LSSLGSFLGHQVPRIAARLTGPGNEATFRQEFLAGIKAGLRDDGLDPEIRLEETGLAGRTDARIEHFIFEIKSPGELSKKAVREEGLQKLRGYLESFPKDAWSRYSGLLTDGIQGAFICHHVVTDRFVYVDGLEIPLPKGKELLQWSEIATPLSRMIATMGLPHLSSGTLLFHFGLTSQVARDALRALWKQLTDDKSKFAKLLFAQWRELFALAVEFTVTDKPGEDLVELFQMGGHTRSKDEWDQSVFVVHTYYSILLKLLALRVVDELGLAGRVSFLDRVVSSPASAMLEAERRVPEVLGNVIERDVFSWPYCDEEWPPTKDVGTAIAEMARRMKSFSVHGVRTDVLRRVYQNIIPPKLRKSLGEFYTPSWAAELLLNEIGFEGHGRLLDPACGSGTFLVTAIHRILEANSGTPEERLAIVAVTVVGYDLNPIAVATSRLNYVLALVDTLRAGTIAEPLAIPVYLADSLLLPEMESPGFVPYFKIPTRVGVFQVPILDSTRSEIDAVDDTRRLLLLLREHCTRPIESFLGAVRREFGVEAEENRRKLLVDLHKMVFDLHIQRHDGIWTAIIENLFAPRLQGRFDYIVGNPPWVIPRRTPQSYTTHVRQTLARSIGDEIVLQPARKDFLLLKTRSAAAEEQYFACTPFVWRALRTYATPNGRIAFLLTSSMFSAIGAGGWRRWINKFRVQKIIDMTLVTDIHEGALCWSYIPVIENKPPQANDRVQYSFCIPIERRGSEEWDKGPRKMHWQRWETRMQDMPVALSRIKTEEGAPRDPSDSPWLVAPPEILTVIRKMQETGSRLGDVYPMHMGFKADGWKYFAFKEAPVIKENIAKGTNLAGEDMTVDARFVFATAVARDLEPWSYKAHFAFLPLGERGDRLIEAQLRKHDLTWQYLISHKRELSGRAVVKKKYVKDWFGVLVPEAARTGNKVAYRLIATKLEAALLPRSTTISGRKTLLLPDQSIRLIPVGSVREGYFLVGLLNSSLLRCISYLCATPKGGVPWRAFKAWNIAFVPVQRYNPSDPIHKEITELAARLSTHSKKGDTSQEYLDFLVAKSYGIDAGEAGLLRDHLRMMQGEVTDTLSYSRPVSAA